MRSALAEYSPGAGDSGAEKPSSARPVCGGSDRFRFDDREGRGTGTAISVVPVTA